MIKPSNGRVVLFTPGPGDDLHRFEGSHGRRPMAAHVCHVWHDRMVNLLVIDPNGYTHSRTSVQLLQDNDAAPAFGYFAEWMDYQKGQAAKAEQLEAKLAEQSAQQEPTGD